VFISAAAKQIKALQEKGLLESGTQKNLLTNQLVLIIPKQTSVSLTDFKQLVLPEVKRISVGEPRSVPAGQYATEVLKNLGILEQVQSKFVLGNNVKSVLTAVETGDVDAGIVYITDAKDSDKVTIAATADQNLHAPIVYPIAVLKASKSLDEAKKYVEFLQSDSAKAVFEKYGFGIAKPIP
jgi:molybdate transport system substrate-binding protein